MPSKEPPERGGLGFALDQLREPCDPARGDHVCPSVAPDRNQPGDRAPAVGYLQGLAPCHPFEVTLIDTFDELSFNILNGQPRPSSL